MNRDCSYLASDSKRQQLYVSSHYGHRIFQIDIQTRAVSFLAGGGKLGCVPLQPTRTAWVSAKIGESRGCRYSRAPAARPAVA